MAVRFDQEGAHYYRTANLPSGSLSIYCWVRISSDRDAKVTAWCFDNGSDFVALQTDTDGVTLRVVDSLGNATGSFAMALGTWYWTGYTWNSGTGTGTFYYGAVGNPDPNIAATTTHTMPSSPTHFRIGASCNAGEWWDGRICAFKLYSSLVLGGASTFQERWTNQPVRTAGLHYWYAFDFASTLDFSGNAYDLSGGTGAYTEAGPPLHWGGPETVERPPPPPEIPNRPLTVGNVIQTATGGFTGASGSVSLPAGTRPDSHVLICAMSGHDTGTTPSLSTPSGFTLVSGVDGGSDTARTRPAAYLKLVAEDETSWTLAFSSGTGVATWAVFEVTGLDPVDVIHRADGVGNPVDDSSTVTSRSTGTQGITGTYEGLAIALHAARGTGSASPVWSAHTNGFESIAEATHTDGSNGLALSVSLKPSWNLEAHECTADLDGAAHARGQMIVLDAQDAKWAHVIDTMCGFQFGTADDIASGSVAATAPPPPWDGAEGSPTIVTDTPRTGDYCLELSATAAPENVWWANGGAAVAGQSLNQAGPYALVHGAETGDADDWHGPEVRRFHVYFPTALPSVDVELWSVEAGSLTNGMIVWYRTATQKLGVRIGLGTEVPSDAVVEPDVWIGVDYRLDGRQTTWTCDWAVTYDATTPAPYTVQAQASKTGMTVARFSVVRAGWTASRTATVRYADIAGSKLWNNYPLGDYRIAGLNVDPAGTPSVSGSTSNFGVFTNNGTVAAWNATNARNAVDDIPPTMGGTADGVVQTATASTEYMAFPMETFAEGGSWRLRGIRWYFVGWAATNAAATLGLRAYDGTTETTLVTAADHGLDDGSTIVWLTAVMRGSGAYGFYQATQAKVDALEARVGYSTDAAPDVGVNSLLAEVAYQPADEAQVANFTTDAGEITVDQRYDPASGAVASWYVTTPVDRGATLTWTISGASDSHHVDAASTYEKVVGAITFGEVESMGLSPDHAESE